MSYSDELGATVAEIRTAALDHYARWLDVASGSAVTVNADRTTVSSPMLNPEQLAEEQTWYDQYRLEVDELAQRFAKYQALNSADLVAVRSKLCGTDITALGVGWSGREGSDTESPDVRWPHRVVDRIDYAGSLVAQMSELKGLRSEGIWAGRAADAFNDDFMVPFQGSAARHVFCGVYLANVAQIFYNAVRMTQQDVKAIAAACLSAFRDETTPGVSETLDAASLMTNLVGFALPGPYDDLVGAGSIALAGLAERFAAGEDPPEWHVTAWPPWEGVSGTHELLNTMDERLGRRDAEIFADLTQDVGDFFYSADFDLRSAAPNPPGSVDEKLAVTLETVYEYGACYLPAAANQYGAAHARLMECDIPDWFGELVMSRSRSEFTAARNGLGPALLRSSEDLVAAGEAIVATCGDYEWTDDAVRTEAFGHFRESLPPPQPADHPRPPRNVF